MQEKYQILIARYQALEKELQTPAILRQPTKLKTISQEFNELQIVVEKINCGRNCGRKF